MNQKFDWKTLDPKVAALCFNGPGLSIRAMAAQLGVSEQTFQRSMRRQGINRYRKAVSNV
jgi:IS30 family transposase